MGFDTGASFFEGFGGMPEPEGPIDNTTLYEQLNVSKSATSGEIKKAFHKMAMKHHPDKGGDQEKFKDITRAYEILGNPDSRARYDKGGEAAVQGPANSSNDKPRTPDIEKKIVITLEEAYTGCVKQASITRSIIDTNKPVIDCIGCNGTGYVTREIRQMGGVMIARQSCGTCRGKKKTAAMLTQERVVDVAIPRGADTGEKITVHGMANEEPGFDTGDIIYKVQVLANEEYTRLMLDLFLNIKIGFLDALVGPHISRKNLDNTPLVVTCGPLSSQTTYSMDEIENLYQNPDSNDKTEVLMFGLKERGMPMTKLAQVRGNLYFDFTIELPKELQHMKAQPASKEFINRITATNQQEEQEYHQGQGPRVMQCPNQ